MFKLTDFCSPVYLSVTVTVTFPFETPVTIPFAFTLAIDSSLDSYTSESILDPDGNVFNFNCKSFPTLILLFVVVNENDCIGVITLTSNCVLTPSYSSSIVVFPFPTACILLSSFISATVPSSELNLYPFSISFLHFSSSS